jgi:hypothetical protein
MIFTGILTPAFTNRRLSLVQEWHATVLVIDFNDFSKESEITFDNMIILSLNSFASGFFRDQSWKTFTM